MSQIISGPGVFTTFDADAAGVVREAGRAEQALGQFQIVASKTSKETEVLGETLNASLATIAHKIREPLVGFDRLSQSLNKILAVGGKLGVIVAGVTGAAQGIIALEKRAIEMWYSVSEASKAAQESLNKYQDEVGEAFQPEPANAHIAKIQSIQKEYDTLRAKIQAIAPESDQQINQKAEMQARLDHQRDQAIERANAKARKDAEREDEERRQRNKEFYEEQRRKADEDTARRNEIEAAQWAAAEEEMRQEEEIARIQMEAREEEAKAEREREDHYQRLLETVRRLREETTRGLTAFDAAAGLTAGRGTNEQFGALMLRTGGR